MTTQELLHRFFIATLSIATCAAQRVGTDHISVEATEYGRTYAIFDWMKDITTRLDQRALRRPVSGGWEEKILNAATRSAGLALKVDLGSLDQRGLYTIESNEGDVLVAQWANVGEKGKMVWLWDTPFDTVFVIEASPSLLLANKLAAYCEGLFRWHEGPVDLKSIRLTYVEPGSGEMGVLGRAEHYTTPQAISGLLLLGIPAGDTAHLAIRISKRVLEVAQYPMEASYVRERFPPLRSRLAKVSKEALLDELGKPYVPPLGAVYRTNRDAVILKELLSRGPLSEAEVRQVILGAQGTAEDPRHILVNQRMIALVRLATDGKDLEGIAPALERLLLEIATSDSWDSVLSHVFQAMHEHQVDFSHAALALVEKDQLAAQSLAYLRDNATNETTLQRLREIRVRPEIEANRAIALSTIEGRVSSRPNPQ